jgi:DNA mismatch repair protein MutL
MGSIIQRLPENVINQVAAGEVVERPASVVKELVENSLDAQATYVRVVFRGAGKDFISVCDNGVAMTRDDAVRSLERHATSKICCMEDLHRIGSFGFRGEALPSIASISQFTLRTRQANADLGMEIHVDDGIVRKTRDCVCPDGTQVDVAQLFKSIPGRRKFLKSDQTEANHILNTMRLFALDFPRVRFTVCHGEKVVFDVHAHDSARERIGEFWGHEAWNALAAIDFQEDNRRIHGWALDPRRREGLADEMLFFVNRRVVVARDLKNWVVDAYREHLPHARSIPCLLFLELPFDQVDINVHPAKREVRFSHGNELKLFIAKAFKDFFSRVKPMLFAHATENFPPMPASDCPLECSEISAAEQKIFEEGFAPSVTFRDLSASECQGKMPVLLGGVVDLRLAEGRQAGKTMGRLSPADLKFGPADATDMEREGANSENVDRKNFVDGAILPNCALSRVPLGEGGINWKFLGKIDDRCALFQTETGLVFFDVQRAAQRVAYEQILRQRGDGPGQQLLIPLTLDLRRQSLDVTEEMVNELEQIGFLLRQRETLFYEVIALPAWMQECAGEAFLYDWLVLKRAKLCGLQSELLAKTAAGYVASAKQWQTEHEILQLVNDLMACEIMTTATDGSLICFELSNGEIRRRWNIQS